MSNELMTTPLSNVDSENGWIRTARVLLIFMLLTAPLAFGAVEPWAWATIVILIVIMGILWTVGSLRSGKVDITWTALYVPVSLFLILAGIQLCLNLTSDPINAREACIKLASYLVLIFLSRQLFSQASPSSWSHFGMAVTIYAFFMSLFAVIQFFSSPGLLYGVITPRWGGTVFGPYVNHNHYAGLMEIIIPISLGYVLSLDWGAGTQPVFLFGISVAIASVLLSGSRGGIIALVGELLIFGTILIRERMKSGEVRAAFMVGLGFCIAVLVLFLWLDPGNVTKRLEETAKFPNASVSDRRQYAVDAIKMFREHPFVGIGIGSFEAAYPHYQSFSSELRVDHAHNDYVEALAESGIAGALLILSAIIMFCKTCFFQKIRHHERNPYWICVGAGVGCCGLLIHSLSDFNLHIPANAAWFAFAAGLATLSNRNLKKRLTTKYAMGVPSPWAKPLPEPLL